MPMEAEPLNLDAHTGSRSGQALLPWLRPSPAPRYIQGRATVVSAAPRARTPAVRSTMTMQAIIRVCLATALPGRRTSRAGD